MAIEVPTKLKELSALVRQGEGKTLEFKRSTGELREGMQTVCAFLNGSGGIVIFGVRPDGGIQGQDVTDQTLRDIAQAADRFEPTVHLSIHRVGVKDHHEVLILVVENDQGICPFTFEGRPYERVESTTRRMAQGRYEKLLLDRAHGKRRWENEPADGVSIKDIDRNEVFRILEAARSKGHLLDPVGSRSPEFHEVAGAAVVRFRVAVGVTGQAVDQVTPQVTPQVVHVLEAARAACSLSQLQAAVGLKDRVHFLKMHLEPLLVAGWIERTIPDRPRSSRQKYRLTEKGRKAMEGTGR